MIFDCYAAPPRGRLHPIYGTLFDFEIIDDFSLRWATLPDPRKEKKFSKLDLKKHWYEKGVQKSAVSFLSR